MAIRDVLARIGGSQADTASSPTPPPVTPQEKQADLDAEEALFRVYWRTLPGKAQARQAWPSEVEWYCRQKGLDAEIVERLERRCRDLGEEGLPNTLKERSGIMEKQMPVESEGLGQLVAGGFLIGVVPGVNNESATIVEEFKPTVYELEVLARHYLEEAREIEFAGKFLGYSGSYEIRMRPFAYRRLATIEGILEKHRFDKAIAGTEEEWNRRFAEAAEIEKNLEPCKSCGAKRVYYDYAFPSPDGYCGACDSATAPSDDRSEPKGAAN